MAKKEHISKKNIYAGRPPRAYLTNVVNANKAKKSPPPPPHDHDPQNPPQEPEQS